MLYSHTPGPWKHDYLDTEHGWILDSEGHYLAEIVTGDEEGLFRTKHADNARLMAAAPELVETLEGTMKALKRMIDAHDPDSIEAEWIGHAHEALMNAGGYWKNAFDTTVD